MIIEIVQAIRVLLAEPSAWTQGASARDAEGRPIDECDPRAVAFSLDGAVYRVTVWPAGAATQAVFDALAEAAGCGDSGIDEWSDTPGRTHAEVLAVLDQVVAGFKAERPAPILEVV